MLTNHAIIRWTLSRVGLDALPDEASTLGSRLRRLRREFGYSSQGEFAEKLGIPMGTYQGYEQGRTEPKATVLEALSRLGVDLQWLITGEGEMLRPGFIDSSLHVRQAAKPSGELAEAQPARFQPIEVSDYVYLPRYDLKAAAGPGQVVHSEQIVDYLAFRADWVRDKLRVNPAHLLLIEASGDSMQPTILHGDLLLLDTATQQFRDSSVYVLSIDNALVVKRIERRTNSVVIKSDNPRYDPETVTLDQAVNLRVVGQVVWHGGLI